MYILEFSLLNNKKENKVYKQKNVVVISSKKTHNTCLKDRKTVTMSEISFRLTRFQELNPGVPKCLHTQLSVIIMLTKD